jgi:NAD+ synthase
MEINFTRVKDECIKAIRDWFENNGKDCNAIVGLSGGKDSTVVAALCVEALGKDRVIGVAMPDTLQGLNEADDIAKHLGITFLNVPIGRITNEFRNFNSFINFSEQSIQNIPPRVRMTMLYAIAQSNNGRVVGTCNASENYIGYFSVWGDGVSDFEPLANLTVNEVKNVGYELGLPTKWVDKTPDDGLPHSSPDDEKFEKLGFNYALLDKYIRNGTSGDEKADEAIKKKHDANVFKLERVHIPEYVPYFLKPYNDDRTNRDKLNDMGYENSKIFIDPDYDSAIIGITDDGNVIYDYDLMVEHLMEKDGMDIEDAIEFIEYNTMRTIPYMGDKAPIIKLSIE